MAVESVNGKTGVVVLHAAEVEAVPTSEVGQPSGVASLNGSGVLPEAQLPASVVAVSTAVVNVKAYGATGNGTTNDTADIKTAAEAAGTNHTLVFPAGTYMVSGLTINKEGQRWILEQGATLKLIKESNVPTLTIEAANVIVEGPGTINGTYTEQKSNNTGVYIKTGSASSCTLYRVGITNTHGEAAVIGADQKLSIINCTIINGEGSGIFLQPSTEELKDITIEGNLIDKSAMSKTGPANAGIVLHGTANYPEAGKYIRRARICDNRILLPENPTNYSDPIELALGCVDCQVDANLCENGTTGISISGCTKVVVTANSIYNAKEDGIEIAGSSNCTVTGNQVDGNSQTETGINLDGNSPYSQNNTISGNTVQGCTKYDCFIIKGKYNTVNGNSLYVTGSTTPLYVQGEAVPMEMNTTVVGNVFYGSKERLDAIVFDGSNGAIVTGNTAYGFTRSFVFLNGSTEATVIDGIKIGPNRCVECTAILGKDCKVGTNVYYVYAENGFTPPGVEAITVKASPFTYTNEDHGPEMVYISGGTVSKIEKNSKVVFTATGAALLLEPNEAIVVTYSGAPTMVKDRK